jgi:hypothetical protein
VARHRATCRQVFEERFTASRMAEDYLELYQRLLGLPDESLPAEALCPVSTR